MVGDEIILACLLALSLELAGHPHRVARTNTLACPNAPSHLATTLFAGRSRQEVNLQAWTQDAAAAFG